MSGPYPVSIDAIKRRLAERIDRLVPELFPNAVLDGHEWRVGDIHGAPGRSLSIARHGNRAGWWVDWQQPEAVKGDVIDLVAAGLGHGDIGEAIKWALAWTGLGVADPAARRRIEADAARSRAAHERDEAADRERKRKAAFARYREALPFIGTPAERYLLGRGIDMKRLGRAPGALRFHPAMRCPETQTERPCLLAAVNLLDDPRPLTIHRTFLDVRRDGSVGKADMADPKKAYSSFKGGFIPLWRGASARPVAAMPAGEWIAVTEGVEDGLSIAIALPHLRVWCAVALNNMAHLPAPPGLGGFYLHKHRDGPAGEAAFDGIAERLARRAGVPVRPVMAPEPFKDFNEALQHEARGRQREESAA